MVQRAVRRFIVSPVRVWLKNANPTGLRLRVVAGYKTIFHACQLEQPMSRTLSCCTRVSRSANSTSSTGVTESLPWIWYRSTFLVSNLSPLGHDAGRWPDLSGRRSGPTSRHRRGCGASPW